MPQPEVYLSQIERLFDGGGALGDGPGRNLLVAFMRGFAGSATRLRQ